MIEALAAVHTPVGELLRFLAVTGWRISEARLLTWDAIVFSSDGCFAALEDTKAGRQDRQLATDAAALIDRQPHRLGYVFSNSAGRKPIDYKAVLTTLADGLRRGRHRAHHAARLSPYGGHPRGDRRKRSPRTARGLRLENPGDDRRLRVAGEGPRPQGRRARRRPHQHLPEARRRDRGPEAMRSLEDRIELARRSSTRRSSRHEIVALMQPLNMSTMKFRRFRQNAAQLPPQRCQRHGE